jgi:hypothetical protein
MWEEPKKMDDLDVFRSAFTSSGIDIERLIARAQQGDVKKRLIELTTDAVARGALAHRRSSWERKCSSARINSETSRSPLSNRTANVFLKIGLSVHGARPVK